MQLYHDIARRTCSPLLIVTSITAGAHICVWFLGKYYISEEMLWVGEVPVLHTVGGGASAGALISAHTLLSFSIFPIFYAIL